MIRIATAASAAFLLLAGSELSSAATEGERLMGAAVISMGYLTIPRGNLKIQSDSYAASSEGVVFKLSDCLYGMEEGQDGSLHLEIVDFTGLTGIYRTESSSVGVNLVFSGVKPRTRCFQIAGNRGCSSDMVLAHMPSTEVQRVIADVNYIKEAACPTSKQAPD